MINYHFKHFFGVGPNENKKYGSKFILVLIKKLLFEIGLAGRVENRGEGLRLISVKQATEFVKIHLNIEISVPTT